MVSANRKLLVGRTILGQANALYEWFPRRDHVPRKRPLHASRAYFGPILPQ